MLSLVKKYIIKFEKGFVRSLYKIMMGLDSLNIKKIKLDST
jgi:hypothetical protein